MEQKRQVFFMTFGGGAGKYRRAVRRICREARAFGLFDEITGHTDESIRRDFPDFWKEHGAFIQANRRGCGYWLWKPFLILRRLRAMREGDILLYADAGCELNPYGRQRLLEYLEMCAAHSVVTFLVASRSEFPVKHWTKMDTILHLDPELRTVEQAQHEAGVILLEKNRRTLNMAREWFAVCTGNNYHYLDDSESVAPNDANFREHRRDQAILTLLLVKHGLDFCLTGERNFMPGRWHTDGAQSPVWTSRQRTGMASPRMRRLHIAKAGSTLNKALLFPGYILAHFSVCHLRSVARRILGRLGLRRWR